MLIVINTESGSHEALNVEEAANIILEVVPNTEKAHSLAESIYAVAETRPEDAPPLIINLKAPEA